MKTASKRFSTMACFKYFFKMGPYTNRGLCESAHTVNVRILSYILSKLNHN